MAAVAAVFLGAGNGSLVTIAVFLTPLSTEFGWLRGETASAYMAGAISVGLGGILMGYLADRFSTRRVVLAGAVSLGGAYLLLARQTALWQFYLFYCLLGGLGTAAFFAPLLANVGSWFERQKGLAVGIATAGQALGQSLVPLFASHLIATSGWRAAYTALGSIALGGLMPLVVLVRTPPMQAEIQAATRRGGAAIRQPGTGVAPLLIVAWLSAAAIFCCICMATPVIHVVALARDMGIDAHSAASVLSLVFIAGVCGRLTFGKLADHLGGIRAYIIASASQTVLVFWFTQMASLPGFYILAVLFGLANSGVMTCLMVCVQEHIPVHRRGMAIGMVTLFAWVGMGLGGFQGGFFFDWTGNYTVSYANAALSGIINLLIFGAFVYYISRKQAALPELEVS
jgi:MFS family permease